MSARGHLITSRYTREIHTRNGGKTGIDTRRTTMAKRHGLLRTAQSILFQQGKNPQKQHRTCWCHRHVRTDGAMPVLRRLDAAGARLGSIKTCGSVWACPVCSAKVAEPRRQELAEAMQKHIAAGGYAYLVTFTFPHYRGQALAELMEPFTKARQSFQNCKSWKAVMEHASKVGVVTSLEVTYGANGWHPHLHMLVFCNPLAFGEGPADEEGRLNSAAIEHLRGEWVRLLEKRGLVDGSSRQWALQYGLDVRGGKKAAEYIAKWGHDESWGMSSELTSSHAKAGTRDTWGAAAHYTPFQLLAMAQSGDGHAICAFREFVKEFDGRRMLTWSRGLKDHFGINEVDDEEAARELPLPLNDEHQVGELESEQLQVLVKHGKMGHFLAYVAEHCLEPNSQAQIDGYIQELKDSGGPPMRGTILVERMVVGPRSYWYQAEELSA